MAPRFTPALLALAAHPDALTLNAIWAAIPREDQVSALTDVLAWAEKEGHRSTRDHIVSILAAQGGGFRPSTMKKWSAAEVAAAAVKSPFLLKSGLGATMLAGLRYEARPSIQNAFYESLRLPFLDGKWVAPLEPGAISVERLQAAADRLVVRFPDDRSLLYFLMIRQAEPELWNGLDGWLKRLAERGSSPAAAPAPREPESAGDRLTPFDDLLALTVVDSAARVSGAPSRVTLDAILAEAVELNGRRPQSVHHLGLRDALFGEPVAPEVPAESADRRRWYLAGYLTGLARRGETGAIARLAASDATIREMGSSGTGPSGVASAVVFAALAKEDRLAEASRFVSKSALYHSEALAKAVLEAGNGLLRREEYAVARPLFDRLVEALGDRKGAGYEVPTAVWARARFGRARCLVMADNVEEAEDLLRDLAAEPDRETKAEADIELGVVKAGFRRAIEMKLPEDRSALEELKPRIRSAAGPWSEALMTLADASTPAGFCTCFMWLVWGRYADAVKDAETLLPELEARGELYGELIPRARLHQGLALILNLGGLPDLQRGVRLLTQAIRAGERVPAWMAGDVLEAVALSDEGEARAVGEALLEQGGEEVLGAIVATGAAVKSRVIGDALLARFRSESRTTAQRVSDGHALLPVLASQGRVEEMGAVLDLLEWAGHRGIGGDEFLALLGDPSRHEPGWSIEDAGWARVRFLEARREYAAAAGYLAEEGHRVLSEMPYDAIATVAEIVERLASYGADGAGLADALAGRMDSGDSEDGEDGEDGREGGKAVRILVVGGAEGEARYDERIRAELAESHPHIEVRFLHSGWTSNWDVHVEAFKRELPQVDGVMMLQHMRTQFGRTIRRLCGSTPWRASWAHGQKSIVNGILAVAGSVR